MTAIVTIRIQEADFDTAREIAQEAFIRVFRNIARFAIRGQRL